MELSRASKVRATRAAASMPLDIMAIDIFYLDFAIVDDLSTLLALEQNNILLRRGVEKKRPKAFAFVIAT